MSNHDTVMRELTILAAQHHKLFRTYSELALALRRQHRCGTMSGIVEGVSGAIESTDQSRRDEVLAEEVFD